MTDTLAPKITVSPSAPDALLRLELWSDAPDAEARSQALWGAALPAPGRAIDAGPGRLIWIEPGAWLLRAPLADLGRTLAELEQIAAADGAVIDITGGLARWRLSGPGWRELLTVGAVFDVEDPDFAPGCAAATILNHAAIWIDVVGDRTADVYALPSYAQELSEAWARAIARMA